MRWLFMVMILVPYGGWAAVLSQPLVVPSVVWFANIRLKLTRGARNCIQAKVYQLTQSKKFFNQIVERTHLFFPFIEKTLAEENVPDDFKFQALHESMLVGDAISSTNDVGFWQIHQVAAIDLKLPIGYPIDERMHLIQSTKAAARFLKGHYAYFSSWLGALLAYNRGRAGVIKLGDKKYYGTKVVWLDERTDPYIISVIATKLAFEKVAGKKKHSKWQLRLYKQGHHGRNLQDLAAYFKIEPKILSEHNKWLQTAVIPPCTNCALIVPFPHTDAVPDRLLIPPKKKEKRMLSNPIQKDNLHCYSINYDIYLQRSKTFPVIILLKGSRSPRLIKANGKFAVIAQKGDTIASLAALANVTVDKFVGINEIHIRDQPIPGIVYYYNTKGNKGGTHYHVVALGESIWHISQRYGITQKALLEKNRMKTALPLKVGQILWLRFIRPATIPVEYKANITI